MLPLNSHVIECPLISDGVGCLLMLVVGCRMRGGVGLVEMVRRREGESWGERRRSCNDRVGKKKGSLSPHSD